MRLFIILLLSIFSFISCDIFENEQDLLNSCPQDPLLVVEEPPELIGGIAWVQNQIVYPEMARRAGIEGRVVTQFVVDKKGDIIQPRVVRGIGGGADEEALRVTKLAKFEPGLQQGMPVCVQYSLPITFSLQN